MLYYFLYDTSDSDLKYAVYSKDRAHSIPWSLWEYNKYEEGTYEGNFISRYLRDYPEFVVVATYDYPILPDELRKLHPEYFI